MESPESTAAAVEDRRVTPAPPPWTVSTNWTIAGGSISSSVAVESSFFPLEDDEAAKSPLIMYPSSPDSSPCEITITFPQKYEVMQVYVRSTARFYEMYYAIKRGIGNEYLSTVRCGIAEREGRVLRAVGVEEAVLAHRRSSEDDWVEVAATESSQPSRGNVSPSKSRDVVASTLSQDLYEATADIADANPCMSFTLRLLSLMNKGCVCVEEVYVFADPIDKDNLDNQGSERNTSGNSLMAMLVPTIMRLSKLKALGQDSSNVLTSEKQKLVDIGSKETDPTEVAEEIRHEDASSSSVKQEDKLPDTVVPVQRGISQHVAHAEDKHRKPTSQPEGILDHLVIRVNSIEDLLLRFEERMLKPLHNIDERLQRVEHQIEVLTKKTENSGLISGTRISAPEFSCSESESNSFHNSGYMDSGYVARDDNKDLPPLSAFSEMPISVDASKMFPALQVSAPDFFNYDVEDEDLAPETVEEALVDQDLAPETVEEAPVDRDLAPETVKEAPVDRDLAPETVKEAPDNRTMLAVSIDDALASALAGFLTSVPIPSQTRIVSVNAPEFSTEGESINVASATPEVDPYIRADVSCSRESERMQEYLFSTASNNSSLGSDENGMESSCNHNRPKTVEERGDSSFCNMLNIASPEDVGADHILDDVNNGKAETLTGNILDPNNIGALEEVSKKQTADGTDAIQEITTSVEPVAAADITECGSSQDTIDNIVGCVRFASIPNYFDAQILDVKFVPHETLNRKSSLEALLSETSDLNAETPAVDEVGKDDPDLVQHRNLIPVEDWGTTNGLVTVDMDYYSVQDVTRDAEANNLEDNRECSSIGHEISAESLI